MELLADKQLPANYSESVLAVLKALSMTNATNMKVVGSANVRSMLYAGDYDAFETVKASSVEEIAKKLQDVIKALRGSGVTIGDIKCGEIQEWDVFPKNAYVDETGKVQNFNIKASQSLIDKLRSENVLSQKEAKESNELLEQAKDGWNFLNAKKSIRHHILRWTPAEILEGAQFGKGDAVISLEDAIESGGMIKVDAVANINNRFTEFSMIYDVFIKGKRISAEPPPLARTLVEDMIYYEKANPFKALKRMFSLAKHSKDERVAKILVPVLNSDLGRLYQIIGDLKTLSNLLDHKTRPAFHIQIIQSQIDDVRQRLGNIYQLNGILKHEHQMIGTLFALLKTPIPKLQSKLDSFIDQLQKILDKTTLEVIGMLMKQVKK